MSETGNMYEFLTPHHFIGKYCISRGRGFVIAALAPDLLVVQTEEWHGVSWQYVQSLRPLDREEDEPEAIFFESREDAEQYLADDEHPERVVRLATTRPEGEA